MATTCDDSGAESNTHLVNIILGLPQLIQDRVCVELLLADAAPCLGHQDQLVTRDVVFLDSLGDESLGVPVGVYVCRVPLPSKHVSLGGGRLALGRCGEGVRGVPN